MKWHLRAIVAAVVLSGLAQAEARTVKSNRRNVDPEATPAASAAENALKKTARRQIQDASEIARMSTAQVSEKIANMSDKIMSALSADMTEAQRPGVQKMVERMEKATAPLKREYQFRTGSMRIERLTPSVIASLETKLLEQDLPRMIDEGNVQDVIYGYRQLFLVQDRRALQEDPSYAPPRELEQGRVQLLESAVVQTLTKESELATR